MILSEFLKFLVVNKCYNYYSDRSGWLSELNLPLLVNRKLIKSGNCYMTFVCAESSKCGWLRTLYCYLLRTRLEWLTQRFNCVWTWLKCLFHNHTNILYRNPYIARIRFYNNNLLMVMASDKFTSLQVRLLFN